ncbi:MAG TPA: CheR family methyltransferase [Thermoanaerobaculia bacterium]|nr:CheR family methyltransferase [Thermoanaerobaculia bacterium]
MSAKSQKAATRRRKDSSGADAVVPAAVDAAFPIVGVGASAGGIEPFLQILRELGDRPGLALLFILHQEKNHESHLVEVVSRATKLPVTAVVDGEAVECDRVYIVPAAVELTLEKAKLRMVQRPPHSLTIDFALRSLAEDQGDRAVGVILSGSGSDGSLGVKAIKGEGGITFAQEGAAFDSMPQSAISLGVVDFVLPPAGIAKELLRIARHAAATGSGRRLPERELNQVFQLLQAGHDVDFTHYKPSTVERRIRRRMTVHRVTELADYLAVLREKPAEVEHLYREILIRVTGFFRDPEVFEALQRDVVPAILKGRSSVHPVRIWVPGCATGEEVYSLAIGILEGAGDLDMNCPVQIFGTDVSEEAVERSRLGIYPENIAAEVSADRLRRFFTKVEGGYRVAKAVRDCCVFARQNLTKDPPFSRLDLVSCRNVMIYLGAVLQRRVMSIFHYALRPDGYLLLGSSETVGNFGDLFAVVDRRHKIYQKKTSPSRLTVDFETTASPAPAERVRMEEETVNPPNIFREADRVMLSRFSPPGVVINEEMEVLQFRGRTSLYLEPAPGVASFNILKMAREGLLADLRAAIHAARRKEEAVRREGVRVKTNGDITLVNLEVIPFVTAAKERYQIVLFEPAADPAPPTRRRGRGATPEKDSRGTARLERELEATREYLQSIIEEQEAMNEELRSANEEIQSSNEELQSTNEELETAKEELQSSNEELTTLNEELENRNQELGAMNNDLVNLLASVDLPIVMLDSSLRIRRFNPSAQRVLNLIAADAGRPIHDLKMTLVVKELEHMIVDVIDTLEVRELEVRDRRGQAYLLRIRPYKTVDNKIEGAVLVLIDGVKGTDRTNRTNRTNRKS